MKKILKSIYYGSPIGKIIVSPIKLVYDIYRYYLISEKYFNKRTFKKILGYDLNLATPKTFNEKIHWFRLYDRTPLHTLCTDKYAVREYIRKKIGKEFLIPLVFHATNPKDIIPENMPNFPFIIKTNHACRKHTIVKDKLKVDWKKVQGDLKKLLKSNFYYNFREWQYKGIKPKIMVEKLLIEKNKSIPLEYKFFCSQGEIGFTTVIDKNINSKINFYDANWESIEYGSEKIDNDKIAGKDDLKKLSSLAKELASDFKFVRVDLYLCENKIFFGELTFSPSAGFELLKNYEWDKYFGDKLTV